MFGSKKKAAHLIQQNDYAGASRILSYSYSDLETFHWRSLLYRLEDQFDKEETVVRKSLKRFAHDPYLRNRRSWHQKPLFDKLVPRQPLRLERDPGKAPEPEVLENMAFISGADSGYFFHLVQLLESIKNTTLYRDLPIGILDCGLTESQSDYLKRTFKVNKIALAKWKVKPDDNLKMAGVTLTEGHKAIMNKPFLTEYFPEWQFLVWLDADSWIQDERVIDSYLLNVKKNGIGISCFEADGNLHVATGVFAISNGSQILSLWQKLFMAYLEAGKFAYALEEITLKEALNKLEISKFLPAEALYRIWIEGVPYVRSDSSILYTPGSNEPLGVYAFDAHTDKSVVFWPTQERQESFTCERQLRLHRHRSTRLLMRNQKRFSKAKIFSNQKLVSLYYRTWPWKDKPEIAQRLKNSTSRYLSSS